MSNHTARAATNATPRPGRFNPDLHPEPQRKPKREKQPQTLWEVFRATRSYSFPYAVFKNPPIRHRNGQAEDGLTVFEFKAAGAIGQQVRIARGKKRHDIAQQAAREDADKRWRRPDRVKVGRWRRGFRRKNKMSETYAARRAEVLAEEAISGPLLEIKVTRAELLNAMAVGKNKRNRDALSAALNRLTRPVGKFPPVLREWEELDDGRLKLCANAFWIPASHFIEIPVPLPTSATVLTLYLFGVGADTRPGSDTTIKRSELYRYLGIPASLHGGQRRALEKALDALNNHLKKLKAQGVIQALTTIHAKRGTETPAEGFRIDECEGNRLQIRRVMWPNIKFEGELGEEPKPNYRRKHKHKPEPAYKQTTNTSTETLKDKPDVSEDTMVDDDDYDDDCEGPTEEEIEHSRNRLLQRQQQDRERQQQAREKEQWDRVRQQLMSKH